MEEEGGKWVAMVEITPRILPTLLALVVTDK
jgi:hypothetical protein